MSASGRPVALALALAISATGGPSLLAGTGPLTVRVNDAAARPGGVLAVVLRTYSPRGIGQGQICLRAFGQRGAPTTLVALEGAAVWSANSDAVFGASFDEVGQGALVTFSSPSGAVNAVDGPLAAFFFRLSPDLPPGTRFEIGLDELETSLIDALGVAVEIEPRPGEVVILDPAAPFSLEAEGVEEHAGSAARSGLATEESVSLARGHLVFLYDPTWLEGLPTLAADPRYGEVWLEVAASEPGRLEADFVAIDPEFGRLPGDLFRISLPIARDAPAGAVIPVAPGPGTELLGSTGAPLVLSLGPDVVEILAPSGLFEDGFESGDLSSWRPPR